MRQRSEDIQRLPRDLLLLLGLQVLERPHVVQPVRQLDDHHANIGHHRQQHLADVLCLVIFAICELDLIQLRHTFNDVRHLIVELLRNLVRCDVGIFNRIMQQSRRYRSRIHLQLRQHLPYLERMNDVWLAAGALLACMLPHAEHPRLADNIQIISRPVRMHRLQKLLKTPTDRSWIRCLVDHTQGVGGLRQQRRQRRNEAPARFIQGGHPRRLSFSRRLLRSWPGATRNKPASPDRQSRLHLDTCV